MPTAAFVAGPEALFRAQPGPLLKNRVFRLEPLFFPWEAPGRPLGGPWEAPGRPWEAVPVTPGQVVPGPHRDRSSWDKCPGAPPGHPRTAVPGAPRDAPGRPQDIVPGPPRDAEIRNFGCVVRFVFLRFRRCFVRFS